MGRKGREEDALIPNIPPRPDKDPRHIPRPKLQHPSIDGYIKMEPHHDRAARILRDDVEAPGVVRHDVAPRLQECLVPRREVWFLEDDWQSGVCLVSHGLRGAGKSSMCGEAETAGQREEWEEGRPLERKMNGIKGGI